MNTLLAALQWDPGFRGILTVALGVAILCGSSFLILATNSGVRLGFLLALTGLVGWLFVMGIIWAMYGIGYLGPGPHWEVVDVVRGDPSQSAIEKADSLPLPKDLPDPVELRDASKALTKAYPKELRDPTLGDLMTVDEKLEEKLNEDVAPWKLLVASNRFYGETQSVVAETLGPNEDNIFPNAASDYIVETVYVTGGKKGLGEDRSIISRIKHKFASAVEFDNDPFLAAVQLQPVIPQDTKAGQAPPTPVADPDAPTYTVILERDRGAKRLPSTIFTIVCGLVLAVLIWVLHSRDKLATAQRAAGAA